MTSASDQLAELYELAGAQCEGGLTAEPAARLEELVLTDGEFRSRYLVYMHVHAVAEQAGHAVEQGSDGLGGERVPNTGLRAQGSDSAHQPSSAPSHLSFADYSPFSSAGAFFGSALLSYTIAVLVMGAAILSARAWKMSAFGDNNTMAKDSTRSPVQSTEREAPVVAKITKLLDCRWADRGTAVAAGAKVRAGQRFALAAGQLEITYHTGEKVRLKGRTVYEAKWRNGGVLSLGTLTARAELEPAAEAEKDQETRRHKVIILDRPCFVICTPTAMVISRGAEFGVAVDESGITDPCLLEGKFEVRYRGGGNPKDLVPVAARPAWTWVEPGGGGAVRFIVGTGRPPLWLEAMPNRKRPADTLVGVAGQRLHLSDVRWHDPDGPRQVSRSTGKPRLDGGQGEIFGEETTPTTGLP